MSANPSYAAAQLAKAITRLKLVDSATDRELVDKRVRKWTDVLKGMADGLLSIGSRVPVEGTPAWVTLEVAHGGFATGNYLAAGPLSDFEKERLTQVGQQQASSPRSALNLSYLTESGLHELLLMLDSGCFRITVPEESALLMVALLATEDRVTEAYELLLTIEPWMDRLRFYPEPSETPLPLAATVHLETVGEVAERLKQIEEHVRVLTQNETLNIWLPLHDEFIRLLVDSSEFPSADSAESLGKLFVCCDEVWLRRAWELLHRYSELRRIYHRSGKPEKRGEIFFEARRLIRKRLELVADTQLSESDLNCARELLRRDYAKRGSLGSDRRQSLRNTQLRDGKLPTHAQVAKIICARLDPFDPDSGIERLDIVVDAKLDDIEKARLFGSSVDADHRFELPDSIGRKVLRCLEASVDELVSKGLVTSGDVLARLVPQIAGRAMAWRFEDERARRIFLQAYRAFRSRRSLLLLNLQKQVQFEELPWIKALSVMWAPSYDARLSPRRTLVDVAVLNLNSFPHAIVPNKLLQEMRALSQAAGEPIDFLDELAADIFMGKFSRKFGQAAKLAAEQLQGTLYARYYDIDTVEILKADFGDGHVAKGLGEICALRAGVTLGGWSTAGNGCVIEQQQILTTQNLVTLFSIAEVREQLNPNLIEMVEKTFSWAVDELAVDRPDWHSRMIAVKNSAYAWRQMVFYMSHIRFEELNGLIGRLTSAIAKHPTKFQDRFRPALIGLRNAIEGRAVTDHSGQRLLGWATSRHWFLEGLEKQ